MRLVITFLGAVAGFALLIAPLPLVPGMGNTAQAEVSRAEVDEVVAAIDGIVKFSFPFSRLQGESGNLDEAKQIIETFRNDSTAQLTPQLIANANDPSERRLVSLKARANRFAQTYERDLAAADLESVKKYGQARPIFIKYMSFVVAREKLALLRKIYGDTPEIAAATLASNRAFETLGDFAAVEGQAADVVRERIAATRMEPAVRTDAALARNFAAAYESSFLNTEKASVAKVNLLSGGWSVERNELTGIIVLRYQYASLGLKGPDGRCYAVQARFEQKHQGGGSYGGTYYRSGGPREMLCENM